MKPPSAARIVPLSVAITICLLFGTLGWFMVGFGLMTDCTNNYSCTETGCAPCATSGRWINAGAIAQFVLAGVGVVLMRRLRAPGRAYLAFGGTALLVMSVLTIVGTTWRAQESYCQPDDGYYSPYCAIED